MPTAIPTSVRIIREEHASLAAVLRALLDLLEQGPDDSAEGFFDSMRAMLFYIDEFAERQHHPKESNLLFPRVARHAPRVMDVVERLEHDHMDGEAAVRALQHLLLGWELLGERRRDDFARALREYRDFYLEHMRLEEAELLPEALRVLEPADWAELDVAFVRNRDPLGPQGVPRDPTYDRLFTRIVLRVPGLARMP
ncbi:hemerythrin domain-containing protein [Ramlibacter sp. H39-3-26]|uniref:hemerythrin domain-containing protein n=1 Tax=Curvibacter soli TaxID=3031331 RepID=UPI0023DCA047|nr:hemerythrin domain-containing protein [Ramlibacter sp. H39-3-26]MDF1485642.1 hemerythrin domain-containing protein [Ramlibacter sp. H39-3-26]